MNSTNFFDKLRTVISLVVRSPHFLRNDNKNKYFQWKYEIQLRESKVPIVFSAMHVSLIYVENKRDNFFSPYYIARQKMLLLIKPHVRLRDSLSLIAVAC